MKEDAEHVGGLVEAEARVVEDGGEVGVGGAEAATVVLEEIEVAAVVGEVAG